VAEERRKLIVGIDPGTTVGYAVLDIQGNIIESGSAKEFALDQLISKIIEIGTALIVGCDKAKVPDFAASFATKLGARIVCPDEDLLVEEKRKLTEKIKCNNTHEMDATASALFAWKNVEQLFKKIDIFLAKQNKQHFADQIKTIVIKNNLSIKSALKKIENQINKPEIQSAVVEPKQQKAQKISAQKEKILQLQEQKKSLSAELAKTTKLTKQLTKRVQDLEQKNNLDERLAQKENRIIAMSTLIEQKELKITELREQNYKLYSLLSKSKEHIIMPRLKNLGWQEYSHRIQKFPINQEDIVFVDDPYSFSKQTLEEIKKKNVTIISQKIAQNTTLTSLGIAVLNISDVKVEFHPIIAVVLKTEIERKRKEKFWVQDIVQEYQQERKNNLEQ